MKVRIVILFIIFIGYMNLVVAQAVTSNENNIQTVHVFVALCDNVNQGIVAVPAHMGNGQETKNNLYWGLGYGVKTYFKRSKEWKLLKTIRDPKEKILERLVFKHNTQNVYLLADAYDGSAIKQTTVDFFKASSGDFLTTVQLDSLTVSFGGDSNLLSYIGHNGLMDFNIDANFEQNDTKERDVIILSCKSKDYYATKLRQTGANPLVWTTGFMAPEAYTLKWAIDGWVKNESDEQIRERAAQAYNKYQKCGIKGARGLLVTGW